MIGHNLREIRSSKCVRLVPIEYIGMYLMETRMMNDPEFDRLLAEAVAAPFSGWDFSWIEGRAELPVHCADSLVAMILPALNL